MQKSWEKIILAVALVLLAGGAIALAFFFPTRQDISGSVSTSATGAKVQKVDPKTVEHLTGNWMAAPKWEEPKHPLFVSDQYIYDQGTQKIIEIDKDAIIDGIKLEWLQKYNLNIQSPTVGLDDADHDGFSNKTEFLAQTDPIDPQSHPAFITVLRLKSFDVIPFRLRFQSYNDLEGQKVFQINLLDLPPGARRSRIVKINDKLEGYVVTKFEQKIVKRYNEKTKTEEIVDESTLTIEKPEINFKIDLVLNTDIDSPESTAHFIMLLPGKMNDEIIVKRGKEFTTPQEPGTKYLLLRASAEGASIRNVAKGEEIPISKVTDEDVAKVPVASKEPEKK